MSSGNNSDERNPFAPPPQDAPDQPWRPRAPQGPASGGPAGGERPEGEPGGEENGGDRPQVPPPHPWSPNWQGGGGPGWPERPQAPQQPRFDPNDPVHRRSRYALSSGMAALVCGLFSIQSLTLLLGALAVYWGISALRAGGQAPAAVVGPTGAAVASEPGVAPAAADGEGGPVAAGPAVTAQPGAPAGWTYTSRSQPQAPAAIGGLITGGVALALVLGMFALTMAYRPYFTCINDALTSTAEQSCSNLAPSWLTSSFSGTGN